MLPSPPPSADNLSRLFRRLVANIAALDPTALSRPVPVADIHERLVPYRTHRAQLGIDASEDYDMTLLRLLAGEGGYVTVFPDDVREALGREASGTNPEVGLFRNFPDATALLDPQQVAAALGRTGLEEPAAVDAQATGREAPVERDEDRLAASTPAGDAEAADSELPFVLDEDAEQVSRPAVQPRELSSGAPCAYCGGSLPVGRTVLFCPHCGQNVGVVHCPTCGSELDVGWRFCITCGQKVTGLG